MKKQCSLLYKIVVCFLILQFIPAGIPLSYALSPVSTMSQSSSVSIDQAKAKVAYYVDLSLKCKVINFISTLLTGIIFITSDTLFKRKGYLDYCTGLLYHYDPGKIFANHGFDFGLAGCLTSLALIYNRQNDKNTKQNAVKALLWGIIPSYLWEIHQFMMKPFMGNNPNAIKLFYGADYYDFLAYLAGALLVFVPALFEIIYIEKALKISEQIPSPRPEPRNKKKKKKNRNQSSRSA